MVHHLARATVDVVVGGRVRLGAGISSVAFPLELAELRQLGHEGIDRASDATFALIRHSAQPRSRTGPADVVSGPASVIRPGGLHERLRHADEVAPA